MINYYKEIFSYVKKSVFDKEVAQDITQETFSRVIKNANSTKIKNERAFLYRVAKNVMIDFFREKKRFNQISFDEEECVEDLNKTEEKTIAHDQQKHLMHEIDNYNATKY